MSHGYRRVFARGPAWEAATCPFRHAHNFADDEGRRALDLHWKLSQSYFALALDPDRLWERLATVRVGGQEILTLAPEETLILLCMHGARHSWARLAWICDIAELVAAHPQMRWPRAAADRAGAGIPANRP